jgi:predicted RNA-binding Zn ribbon-like protein
MSARETDMADATDVQEWGTEAGRLCLDFANTVDWHRSDHPSELLTEYGQLVLWARAQGLLAKDDMRRLLERAVRDPDLAASVLQRAQELRDAIYHIFAAPALGQPVDEHDLNVLNVGLSQAMCGARIEIRDGQFSWGWQDGDDLDCMLWPVLRSAADLLASGDRKRVGQCADDRGCGWLFYDASRNRSRRWCKMEDCGNRAKARRHYARERGQSLSG